MPFNALESLLRTNRGKPATDMCPRIIPASDVLVQLHEERETPFHTSV